MMHQKVHVNIAYIAVLSTITKISINVNKNTHKASISVIQCSQNTPIN